jgi:hypothetical protein
MRRVAAFVTCYLIVWVAVTPVPFPRFIIYLVPLVPLLSADGLAQVAGRHVAARRCTVVALTIFCVVTTALVLAYSRESVRYAITGDRARYERGTWFAPVFDWANSETPAGSRFLVVVKSGGTYALDRPYRRADPEGSGEIDWSSLPDGASLLARLRAAGYRYVIYEDWDWSLYPGGAVMVRTINDAVARGFLTPIERFSLDLMNSRLLAHSIPATVRVFQVPAARRP